MAKQLCKKPVIKGLIWGNIRLNNNIITKVSMEPHLEVTMSILHRSCKRTAFWRKCKRFNLFNQLGYPCWNKFFKLTRLPRQNYNIGIHVIALNASILYCFLIYELETIVPQFLQCVLFFNRDANNFEIKPNLGSCLSGIDFGMNPNDCPGSCNMTYTADTFDKFNECECICIDGYTGVNCTVIIFAK